MPVSVTTQYTRWARERKYELTHIKYCIWIVFEYKWILRFFQYEREVK